MRKIAKFIKENKFISAGFLLSIVTIILYIVSMDMPEWFRGGGLLFDLLNQIAVGFIISFIFFLTQVYLPNLKKKETIKKHMSRSIERIVDKMNDSFNLLNSKYGDASLELHSKENLKLFLNLIPEEVTSRVDILSKKKYTYSEVLTRNIIFVETEIVKMFKYYIMEMPPELIDLLEKIQETKYHTMLSALLQFPTQRFAKDTDYYFKEYFDLMLELREYVKELQS